MKIAKPLSLAAISLAVVSSAVAQTWTGNLSNDFNDAGNWSAALGTNSTLQINGPGTQLNPALTTTGYAFTGTGGKISFGATSGNMSLSGGAINIFNGTGDSIRTEVSAGNTTTINNNLVLGDGSASTISLSSGGSGAATLRVNGNLTGGTGGTPGALVLSFGSTASFNGTYVITGNISAGGASAIAITSRGSGVKELSGTNTVNFVNYGTTAASSDQFGTFRVTGGTTNINATDGTSGWGNSGANGGVGTNTFRISGGVVNATAGRSIDPSIIVDGGTLNFNAGASRFSFSSGANFTMSSGAVNFNPITGFGIRFGGDNGPGAAGNAFTGVQSGGTFTVNGTGGQDTTFSLGSTTGSIVTSYTLSGGVLDVRGTNSTNGWITIGADAAGTANTTLTLSGTGKLISRFNPGAASGGINGRNAGGIQVLDLQGGTLVAGRIDATNLRGSLAGSNGNIVNNGSTIAPGDVGIAGRTNIQGGNLTLTSGTMLLDVFGTTAAATFQDVTPGLFDNVLVSGILNYGGTLSLNFGAFTPTVGNTFNLFDFGSQTGTFSSIVYSDPGISGTLDYTTGVLTIDAVPEPSTWALIGAGLGGLLLLRRRQRKA